MCLMETHQKIGIGDEDDDDKISVVAIAAGLLLGGFGTELAASGLSDTKGAVKSQSPRQVAAVQ